MSQHELNTTAMDMALDTFRKRNRSAGKDCAIKSANLSKTRRKILMNAMADTSIQSRAIATVVKEEWGIDTITLSVIKYHRSGRCHTCSEAD